VTSRPKASAWRYGNYTQKGLHLSIVEPMRRRGRDVSMPYRGHFGTGLLARSSRQLLYLFLAWSQGLEVPKQCHTQAGRRESMVRTAQRKV